MLRRVLPFRSALLASLFVLPAGAVDLESVVDCRWSVERALHERRDWPAQNPGRKPAFEALVTRDDVARRVRRTFDDLARAKATGARFDRAALQAELDRMSSATRDPALLAQLFAAAGDGERAALCLALPDLVARAIADAPHAPVSSMSAPMIDAKGVVLPAVRAKGASGIDTRQEPPDPRYGHTATWTGAEMVVFGGSNTSVRWGNGSRYFPATDSWVPLSSSNAPSARFLGVAVWTGIEVIIFGGTASQSESNAVADHGRYRPANDLWGPVSTTNAPSGRFHTTAVWTGTAMIVYGGANGATVLGDGGAYTPSNNTWTALPAAPAGSQRHRAAAAWSGSEMLIFGGMGTLGGDFLATGLRFTPGSPGTWATMGATNAPSSRAFPTAVWFGAPISRFVVWGGHNSGGSTATGALYDPGTNTWMAMAMAGAPAARHLHTAVSTGSEMIVWGGTPGVDSFGDGARFSPATNAWLGSLQSLAAPAPRRQHTAVWTGDSMIVWGGIHLTLPMHSGGRYTPSGDAWTATWIPQQCSEIVGNLMPNCGLREGTPPTGWQAFDTIARDTLVYRGGTASGRTSSAFQGNGEILIRSPCFPVTEGNRYEMGIHLRLSVLNAGNCTAYFYTSTAPDCATALEFVGEAQALIPAAHDWTLVRGVTRAAGPFAVAAQLHLFCSRAGTYEVNIDDAFAIPAGDGLFADGFE